MAALLLSSGGESSHGDTLARPSPEGREAGRSYHRRNDMSKAAAAPGRRPGLARMQDEPIAALSATSGEYQGWGPFH